MPITEFLEENAVKYPGETALVELNPEVQEIRRTTWKEYELIERPLGRAQTLEHRLEFRHSIIRLHHRVCCTICHCRFPSRSVRRRTFSSAIGHIIELFVSVCQ